MLEPKTLDAPLVQDELFGPVLSFEPFGAAASAGCAGTRALEEFQAIERPSDVGDGLDLMGSAVDSTGVYCADRGNNAITRVPLNGGTPVTIAKSFELPMRVALDANYVYWSDLADLVLRAAKQ